MTLLRTLIICLFVASCGLEDVSSVTSAPVARFEITQERQSHAGSQALCGVDTTGLIRTHYEGLAEDVLVVGHRTFGADDRCLIDVSIRHNGYVAFDLSDLAAPAGTREIESALLTAGISPVGDFDGGRSGCRTGAISGMLDNVTFVDFDAFFPDTSPDLSNPPPTTRLGRLSVSGREVTLNRYMETVGRQANVLGASRGAITLSLDDQTVEMLQGMADENAPELRRFGLYFSGTNSGSLSVNQACIHHIERIRLIVTFRDMP